MPLIPKGYFEKRQDWLVRSKDEDVLAAVYDKTYAELKAYCEIAWPRQFKEDTLVAVALQAWIQSK